MCGITGFIGASKNNEVTHQLTTRLFANCESRGKDAAGYWGTEFQGEKIFYHKEPGKSSEFVKREMWKSLAKSTPDMLILHARGTSTGVGHASTNKNNHPFVSTDRSIGLIHNGRVQESDYDVLKKQWETATRCDSEILLRIFESGELYPLDELSELFPEIDAEIAMRLIGLRDIWKLADKAHMAVSIGERISENQRRLWLFRNKHRPIWLADMRDSLGQIFFVSTPEIWQNAVLQTPSIRKYLSNRIKLIELPTEEIWTMSIDTDNPVVEDGQLMKFDVEKTSSYEEWKPDEDKVISIPVQEPVAPVVTRLGEEDDVIKDVAGFQGAKQTKNQSTGTTGTHQSTTQSTRKTGDRFNGHEWVKEEDDDKDTIPFDTGKSDDADDVGHDAYNGGDDTVEVIDVQRQTSVNNNRRSPSLNVVHPDEADRQTACDQVETKVKSIQSLLSEIDIMVTNYGGEDSIAQNEYAELLYSLDQIEMDLKGSVRILQR